MDKPIDNRAWFLALPVVLIVAFNAIVPLMTVVNYSVQDTFGNNEFFWNGIGWFQELLDPTTDLGGRVSATEAQREKIELFDLNGVLRGQTTATTRLDASGLAKGAYLVKATAAGHIYTKKSVL